MIDTLIVLAKRPVAGRVKTRLAPPLTPQQAAEVAAAALADTLAAVANTPAQRRVLAFDAPDPTWLPPGWIPYRQPAGSLDVRIAAAFADAGRGPTVLVGMDTPQLHAGQLTVFDPARYHACLGPATDGGFWAIGLRDPRMARAVVAGVPMSTSHTGAAQLHRLQARGLDVQLLDELTDVDTIGDAERVAALAPGRLFADTMRRLRPEPAAAL
ncbi:MAG TPA: DUF2064 domain-containing protein [Jatrophihabitantaceae bacterium]|nr:DUF2064 domain-containing protein [Jatrophihabitantaceae bacterium]